MKTAAVHPALLPFLCGSLVDARPQAAAGLFEQLTAIGVWATRPHFLQRSVGDPPTFILCTRPHSSCVPAKEGESPSLL